VNYGITVTNYGAFNSVIEKRGDNQKDDIGHHERYRDTLQPFRVGVSVVFESTPNKGGQYSQKSDQDDQASRPICAHRTALSLLGHDAGADFRSLILKTIISSCIQFVSDFSDHFPNLFAYLLVKALQAAAYSSSDLPDTGKSVRFS
jgi:hypothetical protein